MKNPQTEDLMRDIERIIRAEPQRHLYMLNFFLMVGQALTLAQIYAFCTRFILIVAMPIALFLLFAMERMISPVQRWLDEIAQLYGDDGKRYHIMRTMLPLQLGFAMFVLAGLGVWVLLLLISVGAIVLLLAGIFIYVVHYCCQRFANPNL